MKLPSTGGELPPASTGGEMTTFLLFLLEHLVAMARVLLTACKAKAQGSVASTFYDCEGARAVQFITTFIQQQHFNYTKLKKIEQSVV